MWSRIIEVDVDIFTDEDSNMLMHAWLSNLSPAGTEQEKLIVPRLAHIQQAANMTVLVDLLSCFGSGLAPHISPAVAEYQVKRLSRVNAITEQRFVT